MNDGLVAKANVNTKFYWDDRFRSRNWRHSGREQTRRYAESNVKQMNIESGFQGSILDFGCALGDALPVYRAACPFANLFGTDLSTEAIVQCRKNYGQIASFDAGTYETVTPKDIIIASHVMEHITDDKVIVSHLLEKCRCLYVIVPFKEDPLYHEHVNYYEEDYYRSFNVSMIKTFTVRYERTLTLRERAKRILKGSLKFHDPVAKNMILYKINGNLA